MVPWVMVVSKISGPRTRGAGCRFGMRVASFAVPSLGPSASFANIQVSVRQQFLFDLKLFFTAK